MTYHRLTLSIEIRLVDLGCSGLGFFGFVFFLRCISAYALSFNESSYLNFRSDWGYSECDGSIFLYHLSLRSFLKLQPWLEEQLGPVISAAVSKQRLETGFSSTENSCFE